MKTPCLLHSLARVGIFFIVTWRHSRQVCHKLFDPCSHDFRLLSFHFFSLFCVCCVGWFEILFNANNTCKVCTWCGFRFLLSKCYLTLYTFEKNPAFLNEPKICLFRVTAIPGEATAGIIGYLKIREIREKIQAELMDEFNVRAFHRHVLTCVGPLDRLEQCVREEMALPAPKMIPREPRFRRNSAPKPESTISTLTLLTAIITATKLLF